MFTFYSTFCAYIWTFCVDANHGMGQVDETYGILLNVNTNGFVVVVKGYFTNRIICIISIVGSTFNTQQRLSTTCCLAVAGNNAQNTCALCSLLALGSFTQHEVCVNPLLSCRALLSLVPSFLDAPRQQGLRKMNATTACKLSRLETDFCFSDTAWLEYLLKNRCIWEVCIYLPSKLLFTNSGKEGGRQIWLLFPPLFESTAAGRRIWPNLRLEYSSVPLIISIIGTVAICSFCS